MPWRRKEPSRTQQTWFWPNSLGFSIKAPEWSSRSVVHRWLCGLSITMQLWGAGQCNMFNLWSWQNEYGSRRTTLDTGVNAFAHRRSRAGRASDGFTGLGASSSAQSRRQSSMTSGTGIRRSELAGSSTSVRSSGNFKSSKSKTKTRTKPNVPVN